MINNTRRITATIGTVPESVPITGTITKDANKDSSVLYTGAVNLYNYVNDGNSGGSMGYTYMYCEDATTPLCKVTGCVPITTDENVPANNTWAILTDGDMTGVSSSAFSLISTPLYGYSYLNDGGGDITVDGVTIPTNEGAAYSPPLYADGLNIGNCLKPLLIDATTSDVLITEALGAPSI